MHIIQGLLQVIIWYFFPCGCVCVCVFVCVVCGCVGFSVWPIYNTNIYATVTFKWIWKRDAGNAFQLAQCRRKHLEMLNSVPCCLTWTISPVCGCYRYRIVGIVKRGAGRHSCCFQLKFIWLWFSQCNQKSGNNILFVHVLLRNREFIRMVMWFMMQELLFFSIRMPLFDSECSSFGWIGSESSTRICPWIFFSEIIPDKRKNE